MIQIIYIEGDRKGEIENFHQNSITFGRHPDCDVLFPQDALFNARQHAKITYQYDDYLFTNQGSSGSTVNGIRVDSTVLRSIDNGEFTLQYGSDIKSFKKSSVSIGQHPDNDFPVSQPALLQFHLHLIYLHPNFYLKDLNQTPSIRVNSEFVGTDYVLCNQDIISLTKTGPEFRYHGEGKFAEVTHP